MKDQMSSHSAKQALLGMATALLIAAGPNLWIAKQCADAAAARRISEASHPPAAPKGNLPEPENAKAAGSSPERSSDPAAIAAGTAPSEKKKESPQDLSALFTTEMQAMMGEWADWRSWEEASYLALVTGAPARVVDGYQARLGKNLKSGLASDDETGPSGQEVRKQEEDWLRENLSAAEWAVWQEDLNARKAAMLEAMAEETLYSVSKRVALTPAQKEALYALAVAASKDILAGEWSRQVQFGVGVANSEPAQPEEWYDESIRAVLTPEQWQVWEPGTAHIRSLPDQLSSGLAARLLETVKEKGLTELFSQALKAGSEELKAKIEAYDANRSAPESK